MPQQPLAAGATQLGTHSVGQQEPVFSTLILVAVAVLGVTAGALLAEGAILVPFWRSLPPDQFLAWYRDNGSVLIRFFGPLEVAAALFPALATIACWFLGKPGTQYLGAATLLAFFVLGFFPVYFKNANSSFSEGTLPHGRVPAELRRWARWHWARTIASTLAFLSAVLAALAQSRTPAA